MCGELGTRSVWVQSSSESSKRRRRKRKSVGELRENMEIKKQKTKTKTKTSVLEETRRLAAAIRGLHFQESRPMLVGCSKVEKL